MSTSPVDVLGDEYLQGIKDSPGIYDYRKKKSASEIFVNGTVDSHGLQQIKDEYLRDLSVTKPVNDVYSAPVGGENTYLSNVLPSREINPEDLELLRDLQSNLAKKKVTGNITESERKNLLMIRWLIDASEEALYSNAIKQAESVLGVKERVASEIKSFVAYARGLSGKRRG